MQTVIAAFENRAQAERARDQLVQRGIDRDDVHIEMQDESSQETRPEAAGGQGGISGFFASLFGADDEYERHSGTWNEAVRRGHAVLVVDAHDQRSADEATRCLGSLGALDIDKQASQWRAQGWQGAQASAATRDDAPPVGKEGVLDVVQEELKVGKRAVDQGGVRVIQRVSSKPVREVVRLREERAVVERRPVDRPADARDLGAFKEGTLEVRESAEEAVVSKTARVVEEVRVSKDVRDREQVVEDKLRRKDVEVERLAGSERERAVAAGTREQPLGSRKTVDPKVSRDPVAGSRKKGDVGRGPL